tara:strand:+ start:366 stop:2594 length:2229 start_codon:yes stop_codon:yes gene_type:complete
MHYSLISEVYGETFNTLNSTNLQNKNKILSGGNIIESKINANKQKIESNKKELQNVNKQITDYKIKINNLEKQKSTINNKISSQPKSYWVSEDTTELDSVKNKLKENYKILGNLTRRRGVILTNIENLKNSNTNIITTEKKKQEKLRQEKLEEQREKAKKDKMAARIKAVEGKQEDTSSFTSKYNQLQSADDYKEKSYGENTKESLKLQAEAKKGLAQKKANEKKYKAKLYRLKQQFKAFNNTRNYYLDILINKYREKYNIVSEKFKNINKKKLNKLNILEHNYKLINTFRNLVINKVRRNLHKLKKVYNILPDNYKKVIPRFINNINNIKILKTSDINLNKQNLFNNLNNHTKIYKCKYTKKELFKNINCNWIMERLKESTFKKSSLNEMYKMRKNTSAYDFNNIKEPVKSIIKEMEYNSDSIYIANWFQCHFNKFIYCLKTSKNVQLIEKEKNENMINKTIQLLESQKIDNNTIDFNKINILKDYENQFICNTRFDELNCKNILHKLEQEHNKLSKMPFGGNSQQDKNQNILKQLDNSIEKFTDKIKKIENKLCEINTKLYCLKNKKAEKEKAEKEKAEQEEAEIKRKNKEEQERIAREIAANTSLNKETTSDQYVNLQALNAKQQQDGLKNQEAEVQANKRNMMNESNNAGNDVIARSNARNTKALISKDQLDYGESKVKRDLALIEKKNQAENSRTQSQEDAINSSTKPIIGGTITESNNYIILGLIILFIIDYLSIQ